MRAVVKILSHHKSTSKAMTTDSRSKHQILAARVRRPEERRLVTLSSRGFEVLKHGVPLDVVIAGTTVLLLVILSNLLTLVVIVVVVVMEH
jgi:hypothetical protein